MAETIEELKVKISADTSGLSTGISKAEASLLSANNRINKSFDGVQSKVGELTKSFSGTSGLTGIIGSVSSTIPQLAIVFGALSLAIGSLKTALDSLKKSLQTVLALAEYGSDLSEVQNVVNVTFGDSVDLINKFAKSTASAYGIAEQSALKYTGTIGAMLSSMGFANEDMTKMSTNLTALSGDMASFYNLSTDEAFEKIRSGISGETEPLKQLGINLSVVNLESFALSRGINKAYDSMSQMEQATLRYNYLLETTSNAQNDFSRTSDGWANQTRLFNLQIQTLKTNLGQGLINVLNPLLIIINRIVSAFVTLSEVFNRVMGSIFGSKKLSKNNEFETASSSTEAISNNLGDANKSAKDTAKTLKGLVGIDEINNLNSTKSSSSGSSGLGSMSGFELDSYIDMNKLDNFIDKAKSIFNWFKCKYSSIIKPFLTDIIDGANEVKKSLEPILDTLKKTLIKIYNEGLKPYFNKLEPFFKVVLKFIGERLKTNLIVLSTIITKLTPVIEKIIELVGQALINAYRNLSNIISFVTICVEKLRQHFLTIENIDLSLLSDKFNNIRVKIDSIIEKVNSFPQTLKDNFTTAFVNINTIIGSKFNSAYENMKKPFENADKYFSNIKNKIVLLFNNMGTSIGSCIGSGFKNTINGALDNVQKFINKTIDIINSIITIYNKTVSNKNKVNLMNGINLPKLAKGGIVDNPTIAQIGENGKEAIMPLENNTGWIRELASQINSMGGSNRATNIILQVDKTQLGKVTIDGINKIIEQEGCIPLAI